MTGDASAIVRRASYRVRRPLARHWVSYAPSVRLRGRRRELLVRADTAVCVEGFPRSGNTYAYATLLQANPGLGHVARHLHAPAQVARAVGLGIPTVVLVRDVRAAAASLLVRGTGATARELVEDHIAFHRTVARCIDGIAVVSFDELIADPGVVTDALNRGFDLGLSRYLDQPRARDEVEARVRALDELDAQGRGAATVALPSPARASASARAHDAVSTVDSRLLQAADDLVARLLEQRR